MKKVKKSIYAIIITFIVGFLVPKIADITGVQIIDKILWKVILSLIFSLSTITVGVLYEMGIINGKVKGGKSRIIIYLALVSFLIINIASIIAIIVDVFKVLCYIGFLVFVSIVIYLLLTSVCNKKIKRKNELDCMAMNDEQLNIENINNPKVNSIEKLNNKDEKNELIKQEKEQKQNLYTIFELWDAFNTKSKEKCLTITNDENPDLEWVKIYKAPYPNGKFYGYIKMLNAHNTINGEIYFSNRKIWKSVE